MAAVGERRSLPSPEAMLGQPWSHWVDAAKLHGNDGTALEESFKEYGRNREAMRLCREGECDSFLKKSARRSFLPPSYLAEGQYTVLFIDCISGIVDTCSTLLLEAKAFERFPNTKQCIVGQRWEDWINKFGSSSFGFLPTLDRHQ
ncbi:hypothetical protein DUI87_24517 [Hirundo rustica rustica]|uniref:Uncharacterized protein n=1 Tax=Hirundo rustica rustica TaxID=333673 RepID=A0A3M0JDD5_HIRRU|nr:hypothetical protein DUI87_24517 [Hirundo rustica rustica]